MAKKKVSDTKEITKNNGLIEIFAIISLCIFSVYLMWLNSVTYIPNKGYITNTPIPTPTSLFNVITRLEIVRFDRIQDVIFSPDFKWIVKMEDGTKKFVFLPERSKLELKKGDVIEMLCAKGDGDTLNCENDYKILGD